MRTEAGRQAVLVFVDEAPGTGPATRSFGELVRQSWVLLLVCACIVGLGGLIYSLLAPKWYRAQVIVAPVHMDTSGTSLSNLSGGLGGLASLVGLGLGSDEDQKKETLARMASREFTYQFLNSHAMLPIIYANRWDPLTKRWRPDAKVPNIEQAYKYFTQQIATISEDRKTNLIKVTVDWKDPELARQWANDLVAQINADRRATARSESERNLEFLNRELEKTNIIDLRTSINRLVETEIRKLMLVSVREQYAFKVIDPAVLPGHEAIVKPHLVLITGGAGLLGALLGLGVAYLRRQSSSTSRDG